MDLDLKKLKTWDDTIDAGAELKKDLDRTHLVLGALANYACPKRGRGGKPRKREDGATAEGTLTAYAKAIGVDRSWLSNAANNAEFWLGHFDKLPLQATIGQLNRARKSVGWRPGKKVTAALRKEALAILLKDIEGTPPARYQPAAVSYVKSAHGNLEHALKSKREKLSPVDRELVQDAKDKLEVVLEEEQGE